jgi:hypothetical protein
LSEKALNTFNTPDPARTSSQQLPLGIGFSMDIRKPSRPAAGHLATTSLKMFLGYVPEKATRAALANHIPRLDLALIFLENHLLNGACFCVQPVCRFDERIRLA